MLYFYFTDVSQELALQIHPIHLTPDSQGNLPPSALVPFCSYQEDNGLLERELPELDNFKVCDKFQPTILEGQFCYFLDVARVHKEYPTKYGKSNGLRLLLDPYPYQLSPLDKNSGSRSFKVFIHTLGQYTSFGPGSYGMSTLKKMTGKANFKQLPDHQKKCLDLNREDCQTQKQSCQMS